MGYVESFEVNGVQIKTTVRDNCPKRTDDHISSFFGPVNEHGTKVIGFDTEWILSESQQYLVEGAYFKSKCATVQLCDGDSCLIIQLNLEDSYATCMSTDQFPTCKSLHNLLRLPNYTFVGVGIKENLAKLEKIYGIGCRNAVELAPLAATAMRMPSLSYCNVDELALVVNKLDLREHRPSRLTFDWGVRPLSKELAKFATVNVYSCYKIGSTLLGSRACTTWL